MFKQGNQNSFFGHYLYDQIIPANHFLRKVSETVDFSFVNELCLDAYDNLGSVGNRPYEPALLFKILFLSFLYDVSAREMEEQINDRLSFKWFLNLAVNDSAPDHSTLTCFIERIGVDKFGDIFNQIVAQAKAKGLIHERLKIIDSTAIKAKVDLNRITREHGDDDTSSGGNYIDQNSPDQDARFGRKSDSKQFYGYKQHIIIDGDSEIIEAVIVTPGNVKDEQIVAPLLDNTTLSTDGRKKTKILADKGYDINYNHEIIVNHYRSKSFILIKKNRTVTQLVKLMKSRIYKTTTKERYKVERRFADGKVNHGLGKCRWIGQWKMEIQSYLTALVLNCKRMVVLSAT
ncbi:MAG: IS5 family transposase [Candidatus Magasanikbacteria bacterium]|nr:IS5 family transposase [Candidatus Magasanikbacteria bacterium]